MAFRGAAFFGAAFFRAMVLFLEAVFLAVLLFNLTFAFAVFRAIDFWATALFAFGRAVLGLPAPLLPAGLAEDWRRFARDIERLRPFVTALIANKK
jgi:hypothetical protein